MRRLIPYLTLCLALLAAGCGGDSDTATTDPGSPDRTADTTGDDPDDDEDADGPGELLTGSDVPDCPFDTDEINELTGVVLNEDPDATCLWRNESGSGLVNATMASQMAVSMTYDYSLETAGQRYDEVEEVGGIEFGYVASGELGGEAVLVTSNGGYTVTVTSLAGTQEENAVMIQALADHVIENH